MIKRFITGSLVYAFSVLLFSVGRQLIFFPWLNKISMDLFSTVSFLIILIDFIVYSFGASLADYYVKFTVSKNNNIRLFKSLFYFSFISIVSIVAFYYYNFSLMFSILLSIYIQIYVLNTLQLKIFFNKLLFYKNYFYIFMRLIPYFLLLIISNYHLIQDSSIEIFICLLVISELISFFIFKKDLNYLYKEMHGVTIKLEYKKYLKFIGIYLLFALILRLDMFVVEYFFHKKFLEYYQMLSIYMVFVNPIILLTSSSLLSILTYINIKEFIEKKYTILVFIFLISLFFGLLFNFFGEYIVNFLYPLNALVFHYSFLSFIIIFTTILFQISKTFVIKYSKINSIIIGNIVIVVFTLFSSVNFEFFIYSFFIFRAFVFLLNYMRITK